MKMRNIVLTLLYVCVILLCNCVNNDDENVSDEISLHIGDITVVKIDESVSFFSNIETNKNDSMTFSFKEVLSDNRVPVSLCHLSYGSRADIEISMLYQNDICNIPFTIWGCNADGDNNFLDIDTYKDTLGYRIHIFQLSPYPNEPIKSSDYKIKLQVTKL